MYVLRRFILLLPLAYFTEWGTVESSLVIGTFFHFFPLTLCTLAHYVLFVNYLDEVIRTIFPVDEEATTTRAHTAPSVDAPPELIHVDTIGL